MTDQDIQVNHQLYLLEQKVDLMGKVIRDIYDVLWLSEDAYGADLIRPRFLSTIKESLLTLEEIPDA
jgi:hypothetical protein